MPESGQFSINLNDAAFKSIGGGVMRVVTRSGKAALLTIALLVLVSVVGWRAISGTWENAPGQQVEEGDHPLNATAQRSRPVEQERHPLNPHNFPQIAACKPISLDHPVAEARANIARGDLRPFTIYGFNPGAVPGVFCPSDDYRMESRGGIVVSDMPDACGSYSFSNAPPDRMETYNRTLAADARFQKITGCRPSTYCEERYSKGHSDATRRDPKCPGEPEVLLRVAEKGTNADLAEALKDFTDRSAKSRDAITSAFLAAFSGVKWDNVETLLRAGADINGRAFGTYPEPRPWLGSPLDTIFNQNDDKENTLPRARWLFAHGLNFSNPGAHQALTRAAAGNDIEAVNYLLAKGASPNGSIAKEEQDRLAQGDIRSAGGGYGYGMSPFYAALGEAKDKWARQTPREIAYADNEQRKARINAVTLYRSGGRFFVGMVDDQLRRKPDLKIASILLAAAHREGRMKDLIERILYPNGRDKPFDPGSTDAERALIAYLRKVEACWVIHPMPKGDYVKLCWGGEV